MPQTLQGLRQSSPTIKDTCDSSDIHADPRRTPSASSISRSQTVRTTRRSSLGVLGQLAPARWYERSTRYSVSALFSTLSQPLAEMRNADAADGPSKKSEPPIWAPSCTKWFLIA